jgi:hypothetical protein
MTHIDQATNAALNFPLAHIAARYQQLYDVPHAEVLKHERELKRYLVLRSRLSGDTLPTPKAVDQLWHVFLLYTRDYSEFCDTLGGFIHHVPSDSLPTREKQAQDAERYSELLAYYEETFREAPPADVWPPVEEVTSAMADCDSSGGNKVIDTGPARDAAFSNCDADVERFESR